MNQILSFVMFVCGTLASMMVVVEAREKCNCGQCFLVKLLGAIFLLAIAYFGIAYPGIVK